VKRAHGRALLLCLPLAALLAVPADAATLKLACGGKGPRNRDSSGTVLCAGGLKGRTVTGTIRNDAGQPVAGKVTVTISTWTPAKVGSGYNVNQTGTRQITAKANGFFAFAINPPGRQDLKFDLAADPALGIASGASAQAQVARRLTFRVAKLGGGVVRITVVGTSIRPVKLYVLDPSGFPVSGGGPKNINRAGQATFNLGSRRGTFTMFADPGKSKDLFWFEGRRPSFHL
jgi:hypothetical protein